MNIINHLIKLSLAVSFILIMVVVLKPYVPNNMDEYSLYHTLACNYYPNNKLNTFRVGCNEYDLKLPLTNKYLPIREFGYMGSILSLYLAPFFMLLPDPMITRIVGLLFIIIQSFLISKLVKQKWFPIFMGMFIFFPYFFQHYVDTGTVAIQIALLLSALYVLQIWFSQKRVKYLILVAIICFFGIFSKLTFIWYIPSIIFYFIAKNRGFKKIPYKQVKISLLVFIVLITILFISKDNHGFLYFREFYVDSSDVGFFKHGIFKALFNPYEATQLIFSVKKPELISRLYSIIVLGISPVIWIYLFLRKRIYSLISIHYYTMFLLTLFTISFFGKAWSIHHVVLTYPYLILAFVSLVPFLYKTLSKHFLFLLGLTFIFLNSYLFFTFKDNKVKIGNEPIRESINLMLRDEQLANEYIYVAVDWGMYYYQSLFGNINQTVLYIEPFSNYGQVRKLRYIATNNNKKLLFIYSQVANETDPQFIRDNFNVDDCKRFNKSNSWKILIEPGEFSSLCN